MIEMKTITNKFYTDPGYESVIAWPTEETGYNIRPQYKNGNEQGDSSEMPSYGKTVRAGYVVTTLDVDGVPLDTGVGLKTLQDVLSYIKE